MIETLSPLQAVVPTGMAVLPLLLVLLSGGIVGMSIKNVVDSLLSDDDDGGEELEDDEMADGGGLMGEGGDEDFGDLEGLAEDDDDLGGFDDDEFDDMGGGGGADTDELRHRLDELETEVESISSTVDTVRTENEQISESVDEVEENVRKLLDIYEMVTRGVNPFADEAAAGMGAGMGGDSAFGLFEEEEGDGDAEQVDEGIATADAEGFFDDDIGDPEEGGGGSSVEDVFPEEGEDEPDVDEEGTFDEDFDAEDESDGGKSFQDLKDEYESEEGEDDGEDDQAASDEGADADEVTEGEEGATETDERADAESTPSGPAAEPAPEPRRRVTQEPDRDTDRASESDDAGRARDTSPGKPYLAALPSGFASDMLVVEWLEYLLGQADYRETARAIDYYETVDWIDESVADELHEMLRGLDGVEGGSGGLTIEHHTRSLQYISQLDGAAGESVVLSKLVGGGGSDGIQR